MTSTPYGDFLDELCIQKYGVPFLACCDLGYDTKDITHQVMLHRWPHLRKDRSK